MVTIVGRSAWGALPPNRPCGHMAKCDSIVLHHTVTAQPQNVGDATRVVQRIQRQHLDSIAPDGSKIYCDIAYNLLVGPDCYFVGRGPTAYDGATDNDTDTNTVSVAVLGDYRTDVVRPDFERAIRFAVTVCRSVWGPLEVRPHSDFYATECPGANLALLIPTLNEGDEMTADEFFGRPLTLSDGEPPVPYPTTVEGWFVYVHRELQVIRQKIETIEGKP